MGRPHIVPAAAAVVAVLAGLVASPALAWAADLEPRTASAFDTYADEARRAFLARAGGDVTLPSGAAGVLSAGAARGDGIQGVPGGLVHHWVARAFARGVTLRQVLDVATAFARYPKIYTPVTSAELLSRQGDTYRLRMRMKEGEAGVTAVLQIVSTIRYTHTSARSAHAVSESEEIREVRDAGDTDERLLPPGRDSGYLWRAQTFTRFLERDGGVYVETETLGLSRTFPPLLGWIIEPIARRLGRKSAEASLKEFLAALPAR